MLQPLSDARMAQCLEAYELLGEPDQTFLQSLEHSIRLGEPA